MLTHYVKLRHFPYLEPFQLSAAMTPSSYFINAHMRHFWYVISIFSQITGPSVRYRIAANAFFMLQYSLYKNPYEEQSNGSAGE